MKTTTNTQSRLWLSDGWRKIIVDIIAGLYALLFFYAATSKLIDYDDSELQMAKSPIITDYADILVWFVPVAEIIIGLLLVIPRTVLTGLYSALMLMILFTIYIYSILNFSNHIPCQCGGILQQMDWHQHMIFNVGFVVLAIVGILLKSKIDDKKLNELT